MSQKVVFFRQNSIALCWCSTRTDKTILRYHKEFEQIQVPGTIDEK